MSRDYFRFRCILTTKNGSKIEQEELLNLLKTNISAESLCTKEHDITSISWNLYFIGDECDLWDAQVILLAGVNRDANDLVMAILYRILDKANKLSNTILSPGFILEW